VVVMRTAASIGANVFTAEGSHRREVEFPEAGLIVQIDGTTALRTTFRPGAGWDEEILRIPGAALVRDEALLRVSGQYASFYYWFFQ